MHVLVAVTLAVTSYYADPSVAALAEKLGDSSYKVRQAAYKELAGMGTRAVPVLSCYQKHKDKQVALSARTLLEAWRKVHFSPPVPTSYHKTPWLDMLTPERYEKLKSKAPAFIPLKDKGLQKAWDIVEHYRKQAWDEGYGWGWNDRPEFQRDRRATELYVKDLVSAGVERRKIVELLDALVPVEHEWSEQYLGMKRPEI